MNFDTALLCPLDQAADRAQALEAAGFDGVFTFEGNSDVFFPLVAAGQATDLALATNVAVAFPRSPMHLAYQAWDLQRLSRGRFVLGLGTQIRPHVERRYSAIWGKPVGHMRDLVEAIRAIFACWHDGARLDLHNEYYDLDLMTPIFEPGALEWGPPPIWLGALGPNMTALAGEVADGVWIHPFSTSTFVREHTIPNLARGAERAGRTSADVDLGILSMVGVYRDDAERQAAEQGCRFNLAFYGSTPAYRVTLEAHGWGHLQPELRAMTKANRWDELGTLIDDEVLHTIAVLGTPDEVAGQLHERYGDLATRLGFSLPYGAGDDLLADLVGACHQTFNPQD